MTRIDNSTPVVVLASAHHCGLGITRSLGRLGVAVYNVDSAHSAPAFFSRYCKGRFVWDLGSASSSDSINRLAAISRMAGRSCILIPTTDREAMFVEEHSRDLREHFLLPDANGQLVHTLTNKREMHSLAAAHNVPTAATFVPNSAFELKQWIESATYPVIVKSALPLVNAAGKAKFIARDGQQLARLAEGMQPEQIGALIVQEFIPDGVDWMFNGYFDRHSKCLAGFTGIKIRQCPARTGVTSLGECRYNRTVESSAVDFLRAIRYSGIVDMDFRFDKRDQRYKLLDVNPRIGGTFRLFASDNGMDVARALYLDLTGQAVVCEQPADGRRWIVEDFDLVSGWTSHRKKQLPYRQWVTSALRVREHAFLAGDDPIPVLGMLWADMVEATRRITRQPRRRISSPQSLAAASVLPPAGGTH